MQCMVIRYSISAPHFKHELNIDPPQLTYQLTHFRLCDLKWLHKLINNSRAKHKGNHSHEGIFICDKTHANSNLYTNLYKIYIENSFADKLTRCNLVPRACVPFGKDERL